MTAPALELTQPRTYDCRLCEALEPLEQRCFVQGCPLSVPATGPVSQFDVGRLAFALLLQKMIECGINTFPTSSCGRLFDAVAALLGVCRETTYEAQAAIELETCARGTASTSRIYPCSISDGVVRSGEILEGIIGDLEQGRMIASIARSFHDTMAEVVAKMAAGAREKPGLETVALSGGCFQNRLLLASAIESLKVAGFIVLSHRRIPTNDGGLALGQAVIAAAQTNPDWSRGASCA
jgi:hydrogenase maturation protein HypF